MFVFNDVGMVISIYVFISDLFYDLSPYIDVNLYVFVLFSTVVYIIFPFRSFIVLPLSLIMIRPLFTNASPTVTFTLNDISFLISAGFISSSKVNCVSLGVIVSIVSAFIDEV